MFAYPGLYRELSPFLCCRRARETLGAHVSGHPIDGGKLCNCSGWLCCWGELGGYAGWMGVAEDGGRGRGGLRGNEADGVRIGFGERGKVSVEVRIESIAILR